jgi:hypothetical protein
MPHTSAGPVPLLLVPGVSLRRPTPPGFKAIVLGQLAPRPRSASKVSQSSPHGIEDARAQACQLLDALSEDALILSVNMETVHHSMDQISYDRRAQPVARLIRARLREMADLENTFLDVLAACSPTLAAPLLANDAPLSDYLRGIVAWWKGILQAFEVLVAELGSLSPDWATARRRIEDASTFLLPELADAARAYLAVASTTREGIVLARRLDALLATAEKLATALYGFFGQSRHERHERRSPASQRSTRPSSVHPDRARPVLRSV